MSANVDAENTLEQFQLAYKAPWLDGDRRLQVDDPAVQAGMIKALEGYISIWRKGCTPPASVAWISGTDNKKAFLARIVVLTANASLSVGLRTARTDDYYENVVTIDWPNGANGQPLVSSSVFWSRWHVLLTDGVRMVGSRWRRTLHFLEQAGTAACPASVRGTPATATMRADHRVGADRWHRLARALGA
jgi:hypothetical protein